MYTLKCCLIAERKTFSLSVLTDKNFTADIPQKSSTFKFNIRRNMCSQERNCNDEKNKGTKN